MQLTAQELATILQGEVEGDPDVRVDRPSKIEEGGTGTVSFLGNPRYEPYAYTTTASVLIVDRQFQPRQPLRPTLIRVPEVYQALQTLLAFYNQSNGQGRAGSISPQAHIAETAEVAEGVGVGRFTIIGERSRVGAGSVIYDQVFIDHDVHIGRNVVIFPGARILHGTRIGNNCVIQPNVVIGSDGFGFAPDAQGVYSKVPQVGNVIIEDDVEIGANTTIDRATMGSTIIRRGVKLDNLIQVAHNVEIGPNTVIAAQAGIAGSTKIGANCRIGGQVGFVGHLTIADGTQIQAQSGVASSVKAPNQALFGSPAFIYQEFVRAYAVFKQLPDLYRKIQQLEKEQRDLRS